MKIHGTNRPHINPYYEQQQRVKQAQHKQTKDHLEISEAAMKLQKNDKTTEKRQAFVNDIKQQVESGEYKINYEKTAQKFVDFFTKR